ncbi:hypothetical protein SETIT_7G301900v2 [Setaria italica]|uniref:WRKY domain-containing protein n=1 Tax=Setaria italica TaxID=4555 RepID=A0A368S1L5_SETIT|nr:hypothetical protein SETIT_7G301900v2 [Setaria italica]
MVAREIDLEEKRWRKYGEKKINGTSYTRSYFRCTYKDDTGCLATKHVQQKDSSDHPMFQVTYHNNHTCNNCTKNNTTPANNSSKGAAMNIKQEPPAVAVLPPTLVEAYSDLPSFDQDQTPPCQQAEPSPFPIGMQQPWCGTATSSSTTSSCISGESCDEYSASAAETWRQPN